jgi:mRNA-degrading endonuclease toxin of MazEF toxin-antitoxin module
MALARIRSGVVRRTVSAVLGRLRSTPSAVPPRRPVDDDKALPDFAGVPQPQYAPQADGQPDPGEVVWTWVAYEDDPTQGKDRPVLVIGRNGEHLLALMLSSQDHDLDAADEASWGRHWVDVGTGDWDAEHRPSEARVDRILQIDPARIRRIGATLDKARFDEVAAAVRGHASG